jgi:hypothetical protein
MEPLICPQCGGQITDYSPERSFATCGYCGTRFLIEPNKQSNQPPPPAPAELPDFTPSEPDPGNRLIVGVIASIVAVVFGVIIMAMVVSVRSSPKPGRTIYGFATSTPRPSPTATPNLNLLEFGGKGTGNGLFQDANTLAVDSQGRIYVGDDSMRVQQFDDKGNFLRVIQIPTKTTHYDKARTIDKIAVADNGSLYVAVGGTILIYDGESTEPDHTIHNAPDYVQDFALKSDGGLLLVSDDDNIETLFIVNKARKVTKRIRGFHTDAADAEMSPRETGIEAIRIAVDGAGNIYSVYAFGDLGSYSLNYNAEDLLIFRFTPDGKYVNKFVQSMHSCGIAVDTQSNIYVSDGSAITAFTNIGQPAGIIPETDRATAFALDKNNNVYVLVDDKVIKRAAIQ